jgi:hypothetical protein
VLPALRAIAKALREIGCGDRAFAELVAQKLARYQRRREKAKNTTINFQQDSLKCTPEGEILEGEK